MKQLFLISLLTYSYLFAKEPIPTIPQTIEYDKKKAKVGMMLFFDTRLSKDGSTSCASCHSPEAGGADGRAISTGVFGKKGGINSPTVYNSVFNFRQFWNGRAKDLAEQIDGPVHNPVEMGLTTDEIVEIVNNDSNYRAALKRIYLKKNITYEVIKDAIVEFEKALITPNSKFDKYLNDEVELSKPEKKGYMKFKRFGCITCHNGVNLGGNSYQKFGATIPLDRPEHIDDLYARTKIEDDKNKFKVPTLRNIALTAPYFHDGSAKTLEEAVARMSYHNLGFKINDKDINDIVAFLKTLTGQEPRILTNGE
jgi:cytochrome c peroxidase